MSHYDVLGVGPDADDREVRRAYLALARRHHPDVSGGDATRMRAVNEAWATLSDPVARARYDQTIVVQPRGPVMSEPGPIVDEDEASLADLDDDRPVRELIRLPRWLALVPAALFAVAVGAFVLGVVLLSGLLVSLGMVSLVLSCLFFLASPFIALFASRTGGLGERRQQ